MSEHSIPKRVVPVKGNQILDLKDASSPPQWARYEVRLRGKNQPWKVKANESADSLAKWLYELIGSSSSESNRWQVDWVQYTTPQHWGIISPAYQPIFMLRFADVSDGVTSQLALLDHEEFDLIDSFHIP